ncbi:hypothetical protein C8F04DRAFT_1399407 [Mycena alexandri]|uniref:Uncharacterized protein n=1 Tax=Mycena alexandri TaxID=1745969 RepID=A0AAD6WY40_9AGAR|nr:hypothetical protein C8F04DRAFT_1399407 [Mycena alexandri]
MYLLLSFFLLLFFFCIASPPSSPSPPSLPHAIPRRLRPRVQCPTRSPPALSPSTGVDLPGPVCAASIAIDAGMSAHADAVWVESPHAETVAADYRVPAPYADSSRAASPRARWVRGRAFLSSAPLPSQRSPPGQTPFQPRRFNANTSTLAASSFEDSGVSVGERGHGHENVSGGVQEGGVYPPPSSLLFCIPSPSPSLPRARLHRASPSFLYLVFSALAYTAVESSADGTRFRLPRSHLPIPSLSHITRPHPIPRRPPPVYTRRTRARTVGTNRRLRKLALGGDAATHARRVPARRTASPARVREMRSRASTALLSIAVPHRALTLLSPPAPPHLLPPTHLPPHLHPIPPSSPRPRTAAHFLPRLALGAACGMRAVCVD